MTAALDIKAIERFIKKKHMGFLSKRTRNVSALLLATGELVDLAIGDILKLHTRNGSFRLLAINDAEFAKMTEMREAAHFHHIANPERKVLLVMIDLREVGDLTA